MGRDFMIMVIMTSVILKSSQMIIAQPQVPCLFFFGDSLSDNGNNNNLATAAKSNYPPYGIDYVDGPTGRPTNGKNTPDFLAELLGFANPIPPYARAAGFDLLRGVNYASSAAGIRDESGRNQGDRVTMNEQLLNHVTIIGRIKLLQGLAGGVNRYLNQCLYVINIGSNDYINNFLLPQFYTTSTRFTPQQYAQRLSTQFSRQLKTLYRLGARKVAIYGLGLVGCVPQMLALYPVDPSGCVDFVNGYVQLFNDRLKPIIDDFNANQPGAKFTYINTTSISIGDPSLSGITVVNAPCCVVRTSTGLCVPNQAPCANRDQYAFFDNFHTTEIVNNATASRSYDELLETDTDPFDIQELAQL